MLENKKTLLICSTKYTNFAGVFSIAITSENTACLYHLTYLLSPLGIKERQEEAKETISHHVLWGKLYQKDKTNVKVVKSYDFKSTSALLRGRKVCRRDAGSPGWPQCAACNWSHCFPLPPPVSDTCQLWEAIPPARKAEPVRVSLPFLPISLHTKSRILAMCTEPVAWPGCLSDSIPHWSFPFVTISTSQRHALLLSLCSVFSVYIHMVHLLSFQMEPPVWMTIHLITYCALVILLLNILRHLAYYTSVE